MNVANGRTACISILFIVLAVLFGFFVYRRNAPLGVSTVIGVAALVLCIVLGYNFPVYMAGMPNRTAARRLSIPPNMGSPSPAGRPMTAHSTTPPTESPTWAADRMEPLIRWPQASSRTGKDFAATSSNRAGMVQDTASPRSWGNCWRSCVLHHGPADQTKADDSNVHLLSPPA